MRMNARLMFSASPKPTVIARHNWTSESELDGKATTTKIKVMQVWLKDGGGGSSWPGRRPGRRSQRNRSRALPAMGGPGAAPAHPGAPPGSRKPDPR
jgi:hypothetical protein